MVYSVAATAAHGLSFFSSYQLAAVVKAVYSAAQVAVTTAVVPVTAVAVVMTIAAAEVKTKWGCNFLHPLLSSQ